MHKDNEKLELDRQFWVTQECHDLIRLERNRLRKKGRRVSMAKIVCNLIIGKYGKRINSR